MISKRTVKGIIRNKHFLFVEKKQSKRPQLLDLSLQKKGSRFSKANLGMEAFEKQQFGVQLQPIKLGLMEESTVSTMDSIKPSWMAHYEECQALIRAVENIKRDMLACQNKRLSCVKQTEEKELEVKIYEYAKDATKKIKACQKLMISIRNNAQSDSSADEKTCASICFKLAVLIQDQAKEIRVQQKKFVEQRKLFEETEKASFLELAADKMLEYGADDEELVEDEAMMNFEARNEEIKKIVESIFELNELYKELNSMVIMQGSLLDRIDFNIEESRQKVSQGTETLVRTEDRQKKTVSCSCKIMILILIAIVIVGIILGVRWAKKGTI